MQNRARSRVLVLAALVLGVGCAGVKEPASASPGSGGSTATGGSGASGLTGGGGSSSVIVPETCNGKCTDFPPDPYIPVGLPMDIAGRFGAPSGAGPCVTEPEDHTLFPNNWLRPRIRVPGSTGFLKITFHADKEANDSVAYTSGETWALPKSVWMDLAKHVVEEDVTVTVQGQTGGPSAGVTTVRFQIAPVGAAGSMVFWAADPAQVGKTGVESMAQKDVVNDSMLKGFTVGDESTIDTLNIMEVQQQVSLQSGMMQGSHCIGCHSGTPDGDYVAFVDAWPWADAFAGVKPGITGDPLPGALNGSCTDWNNCSTPRSFLQFPWNGPMTFSPAHWSLDDLGEKIAIVATQIQDIKTPWGVGTPNWQPGRLAWVDLKSTATTVNNGQPIPTQGVAFDYLARTNDPHPAAAFPTWSHDGNAIVYASTECPSPGTTNGCGTQDGRLYKGATDLYEIPYADKAGGAAVPVGGAATSDHEEYYPAFSPDDRLIAFTAVPAGQEMYANPNAELYVVAHGSSAKATRLAANDSPQCSGKTSPGVNNHWPKWAPDATSANGKTYYWLIFSSNRYGLPAVTTNFGGNPHVVEVSQLYITAVVTDEINTTTYPAIYLWNQPQSRLNTTPAWEHFHIPIIIN